MSDNNHVINDLEHLFWSLNQILNQITKCYLADKGLSMPRFWVLRRLSLEKPMTIGDLHRQMYLAPATITGLVDGLVENGLVNRYRDETDRRVVYLKLTPQGKALVDEVLNYRIAKLKAALGSQGNVDTAQLHSCLEGLYDWLHDSVRKK
ncbi:MAG TPA: MarR family transcriptional regulator [Syntrophomonas sp.]|jgi:DNA-binding MarR family transcriptional regulator|nr:MarR family transcriptional regulator [Syntrophomonas sp.]